MNQKQNLIQLIQNSLLGQEDKKEWELIVGASPDNFISGTYEFLTAFPGELEWLNDAYKRKKEAFQALAADEEKGQAMLDAIYQEERERLERLLGN